MANKKHDKFYGKLRERKRERETPWKKRKKNLII